MIEVIENLGDCGDGTYKTQPVILNPKSIVFIHPHDSGGCVINMGTADCITVDSYELVKKKLGMWDGKYFVPYEGSFGKKA